MLVALASDLNTQWIEKVSRHLGHRALLLPSTAEASIDIVRAMPIAIVIADMEPLTTRRLLGYKAAAEAAPEAVTIFIAPEDVREQLRTEAGLPVPEYWLDPNVGSAELGEVLNSALHQAQLVAVSSPARTAPPPASALPPEVAADQHVLHNLMAALAGNFDIDRLLAAYVDAAIELARCASHCFLYREDDAECLTAKASRGLHTGIAEHGRLCPDDALVTWYNLNARVLTRRELSWWADSATAEAISRELAVFRGHVVIPLTVNGRLDGLLLLGEKIVGESYAASELETLFVLSGYVALQIENLRLEAKLRETKAYLQSSVYGIDCGLITLGRDGRIALANPYAAETLGLKQSDILGADLRCLPSPLGDQLHAAFKTREAAISGEKVHLSSLDIFLRVSTSQILDESGAPAGSVMSLEDVTVPVTRAAQTRRRKRLDTLANIIGRVAHNVRTPLTAIQTYAQLMARSDADDDSAEFWRDTVNPELERLQRFITELLLVVEQPEPDLAIVQLTGIVEQAIAHLGGPEDGVQFAAEVQVNEPVPRIVADVQPTCDAFVYLLRYLYGENAAPVSVVIGPREGAAGSASVTFSGANNAQAPEFERIIDPLFALEQEDADLGPAISGQIISKQGGKLQAIAENGRLKFQVEFPIALSDKAGVEGNK